MTIDQLRYFVAAARFEHMQRAAQSIPISVSVVSQTVKALEEELACQLFIREKKKIRLTPQGVRLLELANDLIGRLDGIGQELGKKNPTLSGHYRIGASHFLAVKALTPVWTELQNKCPQLTADVHAQSTGALVDNILAGRLDFGLGFNPIPHPQLETEEVYRGFPLLVVRKNHPIFTRAKKDAFKLLHEYPGTMHIATEKVFMARSHPYLKAARLERNIKFGFDNDWVALENLQHSDSWCLLLDMVAAEFKTKLRVVPIPQKSEAEYTIRLIRHKSRKLDPVFIETLTRLKEHMLRMEKLEA